MYSNKEIAGVFKKSAQLLELYDENPFKIKSYQAAAFKIERIETPVALFDAQALGSIEGVGKSHAASLKEIIESGTTKDLEHLIQKTPPGILHMLRIKGIGPKKAKTIWQELKIESIGELLYACNENRLVEIKGFGDKIQKQVLEAIQFTLFNAGRFHYATGEKAAIPLLEYIVKNAAPELYSLTGALRRKLEVLDKLEFIIGTHDLDAVHCLFNSGAPEALYHGLTAAPDKITGNTESGLPFEIIICPPDNFYWKLFITTGCAEHVARLNKWGHVSAPSEEAIYTANGMEYLPPELRENQELKAGFSIKDLVTIKDLKGILHVHSNYSDGIHSLEQMAMQCKAEGYQYLGISDHSQSAYYAKGLKPERVLEQHEEVDRLNKAMAPFKIFKGIESDILSDGSLDYSEEILSKFDFVIASVHSNLKMDKTKATNRLLKAIENPYTKILGHPTGRLLLMREGYEVDHKAIIDACAKNRVAIELNANPYRLDLDWRWIAYAVEQGVKIAINPDAHSMQGYADVHYGVAVARKGGLMKKDTLNAFSVGEIEGWFKA
jgi:DNA polymerase (family 10)